MTDADLREKARRVAERIQQIETNRILHGGPSSTAMPTEWLVDPIEAALRDVQRETRFAIRAELLALPSSGDFVDGDDVRGLADRLKELTP